VLLAAGSSKRTVAQATPNATPEPSGAFAIQSFDGFVRSVTRNFERQNPGLADVLGGVMLGIATLGTEFDTPDNASETLSFLRTEYPVFLRHGLEVVSGFTIKTFTIAETSLGSIGNERTALQIESELIGAPFDRLSFAVCLVRKDRFLQLMLGYSVMGAISPVADLVATLDQRWPSADLWAMMPTLEDMPPGMSVTDEGELLPD